MHDFDTNGPWPFLTTAYGQPVGVLTTFLTTANGHFRVNNSVCSTRSGVLRTIAELRKGFYFSDFTQTSTDYIRNWVAFLRTNQSQPTKRPLRPMSSLQNSLAEGILIDLAAKKAPITIDFYITGIGCLRNTSYDLFAIPQDSRPIRNTSYEMWHRHRTSSAYLYLSEAFI